MDGGEFAHCSEYWAGVRGACVYFAIVVCAIRHNKLIIADEILQVIDPFIYKEELVLSNP